MLNEVISILTYYHGENNFNMNPLVPEDVEHYARAVLDIPDDEYILASMRTSFTKFHRGLIIGQNAIYWKNDRKIETTVNTLTWKELSELKGQFKTTSRTLILGNGAVFDNIGSLNKPSTLVNLLDLLIDKYNTQEGNAIGFVFDSQVESKFTKSIPMNKKQMKEETEEASDNAETISFLTIVKNIFAKLLGK